MATTQLPRDFRDFLKLLNRKRVKYLLIGGYAVGYHGFPRATADMDVWIAVEPANAGRVVEVLREFGFGRESPSPDLFLEEGRVVRMGVPPYRIEVLTTISGVTFERCYAARTVDQIDGIKVSIVSLADLKANQRAAGRFKDLNDLENLP